MYSLKQYSNTTSGDSKPQSTAEQDMELIRTKRATSTAQGGANGSASGSGQPKSKYRKRSVSLVFYFKLFQREDEG